MPSSARRIPRTIRPNAQMVQMIPSEMMNNRYAPLGSNFAGVHGLEQPSAPKHFPFPSTPVDDDWFFELLMFCFTAVAAGLQFLHLYRSVWWLPHSYNNQAMVTEKSNM